MKKIPHVMKTFRLPTRAAAALAWLADARYGGNETAAVTAAIEAMAAPPTIESAVNARLVDDARLRLRRALSEPEFTACLHATRSWWVTADDAPLIHLEVADMDPPVQVAGDPLFGAGPAPAAPVDLPALAAKLAAMPDGDRAVLTLGCRQWWDGAEPRPPLSEILGGMLRGPRAN